VTFENGVCVLGLGYIGLPTSAALGTHGIKVHGVDTNPAVVDAINRGEILIVEPDLDVAVAGAHARGNLTASLEPAPADAFMIAVPTPFKDGKQPDLSYVEQATRNIAPHLRGGEVVILESTSPPGTTHLVSEWLAQERPDLAFPHNSSRPDVFVAHCPERVLPGRIMFEIVANDRVVGGLCEQSTDRAAELYAVFCKGEILKTDARSAEMAKLVENSFRDVNIAFANELAEVCEHLDMDVWEVIRLANRHPRVNVLNPGPGVGGHCIAVDPWFIVAAAPEQARLIRQAREVNDSRPHAVVAKALASANLHDKPIACLGLAFKADIDDLRESPAVEITRELVAKLPDRRILAVEPHVDFLPKELQALPNIELTALGTALREAGTVLLLVDHRRFREIPSHSELPDVIDTRGLWSSPRSSLDTETPGASQ